HLGAARRRHGSPLRKADRVAHRSYRRCPRSGELVTMGAYGLAVDAGAVPAVAAAEPRVAPRRPASLHIPSLDGLRAISFLIVFMAQSGVGIILAVPGGFGVT